MRTDQGTPKNIDEYIAGFPKEIQEILEEIRMTIRKGAPGAEETIKYQMPTFTLKGNLVHFAAFKKHIGFYPTPSGTENFQKELSIYKGGKGSIRFPLDKPIPYDLISKIVKFRVEENLHREAVKEKWITNQIERIITMETNVMSPTKTELRELVIERIFDAPRERVWKAWTDPESMMRWWGPEHFTAPVIKIDFHVGGKFHGCMRSPEGKDFWSTGTYREIVPLQKIVTTDSFADEKGNVVSADYYGMSPDFPKELLVTVTFEDLGGKTKQILRHKGFPPGEHLENARIGWSTSFDKLARYLK